MNLIVLHLMMGYNYYDYGAGPDEETANKLYRGTGEVLGQLHVPIKTKKDKPPESSRKW